MNTLVQMRSDASGPAKLFAPRGDGVSMLLQTAAIVIVFVFVGMPGRPVSAQLMTKPQVANLIKNVENGVDEFKDYLDKRRDNASDAASSAASSGRRSRQPTSNQKSKATTKKDALDDALGDLNKSTNQLRRQFEGTDTWMETKGRVESVLEDARKINPALAHGSYGPEAARLWAVLRTGINDLARAYGLPPLGI